MIRRTKHLIGNGSHSKLYTSRIRRQSSNPLPEFTGSIPSLQKESICPCDGACPQCTPSDGHDLRSNRLKGDPVLEACYDDEHLVHYGHRGTPVARVQQAITDYFIGLQCRDPLPKYGVDGIFGPETRGAVKEYQLSSGQTGKYIDGIVGPITIGLLDKDMLETEATQPPVYQHTVVDGDSLDSIADSFGTTPGKIRQANNMSFDRGDPRPGHKLDIPGQPGQCRGGQPGGTNLPDKTKNCPRDLDPNDAVRTTSLNGGIIEKPKDVAVVEYSFACKIISCTLIIEDANGNQVRNLGNKLSQQRNGVIASWDGKIKYKSGEMLIADDDLNKNDIYYFKLKDVKYAHDTSGNPRYAAGSMLKSLPVSIETREYQRAGTEFASYVNNNKGILSKIVASEMGVGNDDEMKGVAWAVRNQMLRLGKDKIKDTFKTFSKAHKKPATAKSDLIAYDVLTTPMGNGTVKGAVRWFSPRSMPGPNHQKYRCKPPKGKGNEDCEGGAITVNNKVRYQPRWAMPQYMDRVGSITGVRDWYVIFYTLKR